MVVVVVAWSNLVSAQGPLVLGLGPGLDNKYYLCSDSLVDNAMSSYLVRSMSKAYVTSRRNPIMQPMTNII